MRKDEMKIQVALCDWMRREFPSAMFRSDGAGFRMTMGVAKQYARLQSCKGWPDFMLVEPQAPFHGLFIEIKATRDDVFKKNGEMRSNKHIANQADVIARLRGRHFAAVFGVGLEHCIRIVTLYMRISWASGTDFYERYSQLSKYIT